MRACQSFPLTGPSQLDTEAKIHSLVPLASLKSQGKSTGQTNYRQKVPLQKMKVLPRVEKVKELGIAKGL